jgi:acetylornithine deacetylase/succinyl-diaminopimelate desuccinylase-like protein
VVVRSGVSLPALNLIAHRLRVPTVMTGFGLPDDRPHAPDEKFHLPNLQAGIAATIAFLRECGALPRT